MEIIKASPKNARHARFPIRNIPRKFCWMFIPLDDSSLPPSTQNYLPHLIHAATLLIRRTNFHVAQNSRRHMRAPESSPATITRTAKDSQESIPLH
ncbi:hypothetical protein CEXT_403171 [Caerostris extrusa]|uniref:Uncharacterized protein n=1 Tax=Caerostris extrusa TaxID=172846 RepID=A0AAV4X9X8_CAEEX|nr:hypothetical protein CEXT_403171 [Caerostris extrusa]